MVPGGGTGAPNGILLTTPGVPAAEAPVAAGAAGVWAKDRGATQIKLNTNALASKVVKLRGLANQGIRRSLHVEGK